jgi:hypothetical protein
MRKKECGADKQWKSVTPTEREVDQFLFECALYRLEPLAGQIYASWSDHVLKAVATIDGLRLRASRSEFYDGQSDPEWCGADGVWRDFWSGDEHPVAARVRVYIKGIRVPISGVANWSDFAPTSPVGPGAFWSESEGMPVHMLSIRAEALALRKAFPAELSGLYTVEELGISIPGEMPAGAAAVDVPSTPATIAPPVPASETPSPGPVPSVIVDPPESQPHGAPASPQARRTLAEVLASADYRQAWHDLVKALFDVMPDRLTDEQTEQLTAALRDAEEAGITAAELEHAARKGHVGASDNPELRARAILGWIAERRDRALRDADSDGEAPEGRTLDADPANDHPVPEHVEQEGGDQPRSVPPAGDGDGEGARQ